jgi:phosphoribosylamine--glycine ligase/phosphoribosylformylglycinamidine cyclo-ligase
MNVLIVGSGGREHALAWKISQSPRLGSLFLAPGNAGTRRYGTNLPVSSEDIPALVAVAQQKEIDLVVVGPEGPLAEGLVNALRAKKIRAFGPTRAAAEIESSKAFAKDFMVRYHIPTPRYARFTRYEEALKYLNKTFQPVVIKASGLAGGKGVIIPETREQALASLKAIMVDAIFGVAGEVVIIEEKLEGQEISLMAFSDGRNIKAMPPAQDHKRLLDGNRGPNTGGMGAIAPTPICPPEMADSLAKTILQPAIDGLREEGSPFIGVLYAGIILTSQGPYVLEFNARFGDPETQVIMPLLESDLIDIMEACVDGNLANTEAHWKSGAAACVVLASEGYPRKTSAGKIIQGPRTAPLDATVFHAGTQIQDNQVITSGGRVLGVTGWGATLEEAIRKAYWMVEGISFQGMQYRKDIGQAALSSVYAASGVNIDAGSRAVELMKQAVSTTYKAEVLAGIGAFGGMYSAKALKSMKSPVLVASTDGVGTKTRLAAQALRYPGIGQDIVNHCINDILVQGARPLFFLDYIAASRLKPEVVAEIVAGMVTACREADCSLLEGEFDVAGTIVGLVEQSAVLPRPGIQAGDVLVGLKSSGPHTNGYSLIRSVFVDVPLDTVFPEIGVPLADVLLAPHRSYFRLLYPLISRSDSPLKALAHLTGGGFLENIPRILPDGLGVEIRTGSWPVPPIFRLIQERGQVSSSEMHRVFNLGIGMVAILASQDVPAFQQALGEESWIIGEVQAGERKVVLC